MNGELHWYHPPQFPGTAMFRIICGPGTFGLDLDTTNYANNKREVLFRRATFVAGQDSHVSAQTFRVIPGGSEHSEIPNPCALWDARN